MGYFQSLATATLGLSMLYTGSNANLVARQGLGPPASLPSGWSYKGCYTYDLLYPPPLVRCKQRPGQEILTDDHAETLSAKDRCKVLLLQAVIIRMLKNVSTSVLLLGIA